MFLIKRMVRLKKQEGQIKIRLYAGRPTKLDDTYETLSCSIERQLDRHA